MANNVNIVGICGSTRARSFNLALLQAAVKHLPINTQFIEADITDLPFFNQELEQSLPESVVRFAEQIRSADAIIISTPEYNYSVPGVLKNALEWVSRPSSGPAIAGKPVAIIGASGGMFGPARGHMHLRQILFSCNAAPLNRPEVYVNNAVAKFNENLELTDEMAHQLLSQLMDNLVSAIEKNELLKNALVTQTK